jgi:hypothetical protein
MNDLAPVTEEGRLWACISYASVFTGLPLFLLPLVQRRDEFAIHHAKQAAEAYIWFLACITGYIVLSLATCGIGTLCFPIVLFPYVPMIHGMILAVNNEWRAPIGILGMGDSMLANVRADRR